MTARTPVAFPSQASGGSAVDALAVGDEPRGIVKLMSAGDAQRLTQHIKLTASGVRNGLFKLRNLIDEAKHSNVWNVLGFASWTSYLADTLGEEPMRVSREERLELVGYLAGEGLSTRAIAPIVGASHMTIARDLETSSGVTNVTPDEPSVESPSTPEAVAAPADSPDLGVATINLATGEITEPTITERTVTETTRTITGLDGKTYTSPKPREPKPVLAGDSLAKFDAESNSKSLGEALRVLERIASPSHRDHMLTIWWPEGREAVAPTARDLFTPGHLRDFATALLKFADELEARS